MKPVDEYYFTQEEPYQSIMLYVRSLIMNSGLDIIEHFSYRIPFYKVDKKPLLYINRLKGTQFVDVAFVQGILLEAEFPELKNFNNRKQVRSIQLSSIEDLDEVQFLKLLERAVEVIGDYKKPWHL